MKGQCLSFNLVPALSPYVEHRLSYDKCTMYTLIIQNRIIGCHGNGAISHKPNRFFLLDKTICIYLVPVSNSMPIKNCPGSGVQGRSN